MTVRVDYTQLGVPPTRLSVGCSLAGLYSVVDQDGRLYFPPTDDLDKCVRFIRASAERHGVLVDEDSIEYERMNRLHSVRVDRAWALAYGEGIDLAPVIPIRKGA
jgi:hypothetical protein